MTNPARLTLEQPLDIDEARRASRRLAELRREVEDSHKASIEVAADNEAAYRKAYARAFIGAEGTAAEREAIARSESADACRLRDVSAGMVKVFSERLRGLEGERSMLKSLIEWSAREAERPAPDTPPIGALR